MGATHRDISTVAASGKATGKIVGYELLTIIFRTKHRDKHGIIQWGGVGAKRLKLITKYKLKLFYVT